MGVLGVIMWIKLVLALCEWKVAVLGSRLVCMQCYRDSLPSIQSQYLTPSTCVPCPEPISLLSLALARYLTE